MTVEDRLQATVETLSNVVQTKVKPSERKMLEDHVAELNDRGVKTTLSALVRAIVLDYLEGLDESTCVHDGEEAKREAHWL